MSWYHGEGESKGDDKGESEGEDDGGGDVMVKVKVIEDDDMFQKSKVNLMSNPSSSQSVPLSSQISRREFRLFIQVFDCLCCLLMILFSFS